LNTLKKIIDDWKCKITPRIGFIESLKNKELFISNGTYNITNIDED